MAKRYELKTCSGRVSLRCCRARSPIPAEPRRTTACSSTACSGSCDLERNGTSCPSGTANGRACTSASHAGRRPASGSRCSPLSSMIPGTSTRCSMPPSSGPTSRPPPAKVRPKRGADEALGRSRGGLTTKIHLLADALGRPLRFLLTGGEVHESRTAEAMLDGVDGDAVIADKAYDSNAIRDTIKAAGMKAVIPSNRSRKRRFRHVKALYRRAQPHRCPDSEVRHTLLPTSRANFGITRDTRFIELLRVIQIEKIRSEPSGQLRRISRSSHDRARRPSDKFLILAAKVSLQERDHLCGMRRRGAGSRGEV